MAVLGSDPDSEQKGWDDAPVRTTRPRRVVNDLINYFGYHKGMRMSQRFDDKDRVVLASYFSKRMSNGITPDSLRKLVDLFYASPHSHSNFPAMTFCKKEVQEQLLLEVDVASSDPYIQWLADGMPDAGPLSDPKGTRKAVLVHADDSLYRYPEVVADIVRLDYSYDKTSRLLVSLNEVLCWCLGASKERPDVSELSSLVILPEELEGKYHRKAKIRDKSDTFLQAVARIPRKKEKW